MREGLGDFGRRGFCLFVEYPAATVLCAGSMGLTLVSLLVVAGAPSIAIDGPAELASEVRARVERELGAVEWTDADGDLSLVIRREAERLSVRILEGEATLESREVDATDPDAATRVVALLLVDAIERWRPPPAPPPEPPAWRIAAAVEGLSWASPFTPQTGASVGAARRIGPLWIGARIAWRRFCCTITAEDLGANARTLSATGEVRWEIATFGRIDLGVTGALGIAHDRVEATAIFPGGRGPPEVTSQAQLAGRAAGWIGVRAGPLDAGLAGGLWVQASTLRVRLPTGFEGTELSRGIVAPYLAGEVGVRF